MAELALGTVQFGLAYGATNTRGQVPEDEVARILGSARQAGVRFLDTASAYGTAEAVLGRTLPPGHDFRIVTKTPAWRADRDLHGNVQPRRRLLARAGRLPRCTTPSELGLRRKRRRLDPGAPS